MSPDLIKVEDTAHGQSCYPDTSASAQAKADSTGSLVQGNELDSSSDDIFGIFSPDGSTKPANDMTTAQGWCAWKMVTLDGKPLTAEKPQLSAGSSTTLDVYGPALAADVNIDGVRVFVYWLSQGIIEIPR